MAVAKIILVQGILSAEIDMVEKTYKGNLPIEEARKILQPMLLDLVFKRGKDFTITPE